MDNQIQCLVRHCSVLVLQTAFSAHRAEVRTFRTIFVLQTLVLLIIGRVIFLFSVPVCFRNIGFAADKIFIGKVDKVGVKEDDFELLRRLFGAVGIDGNGLFIVSCERYFILFQWLKSSLSFLNLVWSGGTSC